MIDTVVGESTQSTPSFKDVIRTFAPSWFASVMGTGALALGLFSYGSSFHPLVTAGKILFIVNIILFVILLVPWTLRWILYPKETLADLHHPVMANFFPTVSAGLIVLALDFIVIGQNFELGAILWAIGSVVTIFFSILTPYFMFTSTSTRLDHMNPGFFIPPVALLVIPLGGGLLLPHLSANLVPIVVLFNFFGLGAGFFLYLALLAITLYRFILHEPLPAALAATVWINLGPLGAAAVGLINIAKATPFITMKEPYFVAALLIWGFALWWLMMAVVMSLHYIGRMKFPYGLSWWGFTFPTGALVLASHSLAAALSMPLIDHIGFALLWLLVALWIMTLAKTVQRTIDGSLFRPAKQAEAPRAAEVSGEK
ncbi:MAG TPA: tellurite-resistance/dicarboxylate transporter [Spirochaetia bacterium]|nr:tellurite-resistance/dicarboxylate transporter [Spirochaetia bacterium]